MPNLKTTPEERAALRAEEERRRSDAARCPSVRFSQLYDRGGRLLCALDDLDTLAAEVGRLVAENAAMRQALDAIDDGACETKPYESGCDRKCRSVAYRALNRETK